MNATKSHAELINSLVTRITEIEVSILPLKAAVDALRASAGKPPIYGLSAHTLPQPGDILTIYHEMCEVVEVRDHVVHYHSSFSSWEDDDDDAAGVGEIGMVSLDVWYKWIDLPEAVLELSK